MVFLNNIISGHKSPIFPTNYLSIYSYVRWKKLICEYFTQFRWKLWVSLEKQYKKSKGNLIEMLWPFLIQSQQVKMREVLDKRINNFLISAQEMHIIKTDSEESLGTNRKYGNDHSKRVRWICPIGETTNGVNERINVQNSIS